MNRSPYWRIFPDSTLSAFHDGEGWCIQAERPGGTVSVRSLYGGCAHGAWGSRGGREGARLQGRAAQAELMPGSLVRPAPICRQAFSGGG